MSVTPNMPLPSSAREQRMSSRRLFVLVASAVVVIGGVITGAFVLGQRTGQDDDLAARQQDVSERGSLVMPFDLEATTHVFTPTDEGGLQSVVADDLADEDQVTLIRSHLRDEVAAFKEGDFGDPATIHGHEMPGLSVLESNSDKLTITYRDLPAGGEVTYRSTDATVIQALHDWFQAQLMDHGDDAQPG